MSAAARARRLNESAEIVVLERGNHVSFANCGLPYHIGGVITDRDELLLQTPQSLKAALNLDVRVGHEVVSIDRKAKTVSIREVKGGRAYSETYDKLVLAPGAVPVRPPLPGIDHTRIFCLRNIDDMDRIKHVVDAGAKHAVVVGGGYIGVEMAENLRERALSVELVELLDQIMPPFDKEMAHILEKHIVANGVKLHLGTAAAAFRDISGRVAVELKNGTVIEADLVVLSIGVKPDSSLAKQAGIELGATGGIMVNEHMLTSDPDIYAVGDAVEVLDCVTGGKALMPLAGPANRQGRIAADNMMGISSRYDATQGTAILKVFAMTAGGTGASEKTLKKAGKPYRKVYIHPSGHAGYYPDTAQMHIKAMFAPDDGRLLGVQIAGFDGVDKRLDVFATAVRAGLTVYDLRDLELAYAPPYGSAKDPANMVGFVAENLLTGRVAFWYAEDYPQKTDGEMILDVRSAEEFEDWHIHGAVNIPLGKIRSRLGDIPKDKAIFLYCKVGFRSYLAYRVLKQSGFEKVMTLAGGTTTFLTYKVDEAILKQKEVPFVAYTEEKMASHAAPSGKTITVDCNGMQCPGPIKKLGDAIVSAAIGDELVVSATDQGFDSDASAWCRRNSHELLGITRNGMCIEAHIRKCTAPTTQSGTKNRDGFAMIVFSGDLDKVLAAFVIANGALAMGMKPTMFFTFWGLNALRKAGPQASGKPLIDQMFGTMMPKGPAALKLSSMNMMGIGTELMKHVMKTKNVNSLPELMDQARRGGVRLVACTMSMDIMGLRSEELIDGIEFGGVATFLEAAEKSSSTLFI